MCSFFKSNPSLETFLGDFFGPFVDLSCHEKILSCCVIFELNHGLKFDRRRAVSMQM